MQSLSHHLPEAAFSIFVGPIDEPSVVLEAVGDLTPDHLS